MRHSVGENWLEDSHGRLGVALRDANDFVSDTNDGWGPPDEAAGGVIGDHTNIGHWWSWFVGPYRATYLAALLAESGQHSSYGRLASDPGGPNRIVMFKSCFPNSELAGKPNDPPTGGANPLRGNLEPLTVGNTKGIYIELLSAFAARQDILMGDDHRAAGARWYARRKRPRRQHVADHLLAHRLPVRQRRGVRLLQRPHLERRRVRRH